MAKVIGEIREEDTHKQPWIDYTAKLLSHPAKLAKVPFCVEMLGGFLIAVFIQHDSRVWTPFYPQIVVNDSRDTNFINWFSNECVGFFK